MSELNKLKVVDFTAGRLSSDDINTDIPFADNFEKTRTIQQANAVIGAYVNRNYKDMSNKADKDEIPTKVSELENDEGYITTGDIPSKTSDLVNDSGFITKEVNDLTNYLDKTTVEDEFDSITADMQDFNGELGDIKTAIDFKAPKRVGDLVVDSIRSKNLCNIQDLRYLINANGVVTENGWCWTAIVDTRNINSLYISGNFSLLADGVLRIGGYSAYPVLGSTGTRHSLSSNGALNTTSYNYVVFSFLQTGTTTKDQIQNSFQIEKGNTGTTYMPFQELGTDNFKNEEIFVGNIKSKNMLDVRGIQQITNNGITCTYDNSTNIITLNGTVSGYQANFTIESATGMKLKKENKYTTSIFYISGTTTGNLKFFAQDGNHSWAGLQMEFGGSNASSTLQFDDDLTITPSSCLIRAYSGQVLDNLKFKIQVEEGSTTTNYMPYQDLENKELYSVSEIMIGTWLSGKPLYRKVVHYTSTISVGWNGVAFSTLGLSNISYLRVVSALGKSGDTYEELTSHENRVLINKSNNTLSLYSTDTAFSETIFILEYTKTTD